MEKQKAITQEADELYEIAINEINEMPSPLKRIEELLKANYQLQTVIVCSLARLMEQKDK